MRQPLSRFSPKLRRRAQRLFKKRREAHRNVLGMSLLALTGCELSDVQQQALSESLSSGSTSPTYQGDGFGAQAACFSERFVQPEPVISRKVDLLFVIDSSGSLNAERQAVADGVDAFVRALGDQADYRVAVMLAHSPVSSKFAKLYKKGSEPTVLSSQSMTLSEIQTALRSKVSSPATDYAADGGELGLLSLHAALDETSIATMQAQDFLRNDAAWAITFIADEQDICYDYPAGVTPVADPDRIESRAKTRYCTRNVGGASVKVTAASVFEKLQAARAAHGADQRAVVGGVVYNGQNPVPRSGENELGYGYLDLIQLAQGISIDLADGTYASGLESLGTLVQVRQQTLNTFTLAHADIDPATIAVKVDGATAAFTYDAATQSLVLADPGQSLSVIDYQYCLKPALPPTGCVGSGCDSIGL